MVTTHTTIKPGYGILANEEGIYANSEEYYADGAIRMRDSVPAMLTSSEEAAGTIQYDVAGNIISHNDVNLIKSGDQNILTGSIDYDASGAVMHHKYEVASSTTSYDDVNLIKCGDQNILVGSIDYDASGAVMHHKEGY